MRHRLLPLFAALLALTTAGHGVRAAEGGKVQRPDAAEDIYFSDIPVVLTVSRLAQSQADAPGAVTVIDRDMIRMSGARDVSDLLRLVPGFQVTPPNQDAARVVYHGLSEEYPPRTQVLIDGRSQYSALYIGGVNWNMLPVSLEDIDRIEVIRGSNSAAYGSNAFLGVINIITLDPSQTRGTLVRYQQGNYGIRDSLVRIGQGSDSFNYRLTLRSNADEGTANVFDDRLAQTFDFRADWQLTDRDQLRFSAGRTRNDVQWGAPARADNPLRVNAQRNSHLQVDWQRILGAGEEVQVRYSRQLEWASDRHLEQEGNYSFLLDYGGHSQRDDLEFQHTSAPWENVRLAWGGGARIDRVVSPLIYGSADGVQRQVQRLFGSLEWRFRPEWLLNVGGTWEHDALAGTTFAPRVSLNHRLLPDHTLRLTASRAYRTPSTAEFRSLTNFYALNDPAFIERMTVGNPNLRPERIDGVEIGYLGEFKPWHLNADIRVYYERISDRLLQVPVWLPAGQCETLGGSSCGRVDTTYNAESLSNKGLEYQLRWQPFSGSRVLFSQAYQKVGARLYDLPIADSANRIAELPDKARSAAPTRSSSLMWMQQLPYGFELSAMWYQMTGVRWTTNSRVGEYERVDWRLAYPFRTGGKTGEVAWTVQSANGDHAEFRPNQPVTPRHWWTLRLEL